MPGNNWVNGYAPLYMGSATYVADDVQLTSPTFAGGATETVSVGFYSTVDNRASTAWQVAVTVTDAVTGLPITGATVQVLSATSRVDDSGVTDGSGVVSGLRAIVRTYTGHSISPIVITPVSHTPHSLSVSCAGLHDGNAISGDIDG